MAKLPTIILLVFCCMQQILSASVDSVNSLVTTSTAPTEDSDKEGGINQATLHSIQISQMHVTSNVANRFARTTVVSKVKNAASKSQEATFSIVLPDTAFISGFIMEINGKNYTAYVKEKEEAKKTYDEAVASGLGAAHVSVSARDSNRFTVSVNIEPEGKATFYLSYEELLRRQEGHYELIINLHPGQPVKDLLVEVKISESSKLVQLKAPPLRSGNEIGEDKEELDPRADIKIINDRNAVVTFSPNLERQKELAGKLGTESNQGIAGQFIVQYDVDRDSSGGEVLLQDGYFVHFFAPSDLQPLPKHVVFILDTSSSMYGQKIVQLREAMLKILEQLNEQDKFNLVEFNSNVKVWNLFANDKSVWFPARSDDYSWGRHAEPEPNISSLTFPAAYPANADNIKKAKEAVSTLTPTAATDIHSALKVGLYLVEIAKEKESKHQPIIIFLTDGDPTVRTTSTETIITQITEYNSGPRKSVLFTLSFGNDADKTFLKKLANRNLGFTRHIYEAGDAALQLENFYKQISSPLLSNVTFKYEPSVTSLTKTDFPIHFGGSEIVVSGFCGTPDFVPPTINGWSDHGWISLKPKIVRSITSTERLWAYLTVKQLLDKKEASDKDEEEFKKKALALALKYEFVTAVSSLVVVKPNATDDNLQPEAADKGDSGGGLVAHRFKIGSPGIAGPPGPPRFSYAQSASIPLSLPQPVFDSDVYGPPPTIRTTTVVYSTTEFNKQDLFLNIPWIKNILKDDRVTLAKGVFKLGTNETITDVIQCTKTPLNEAGYCKLLKNCKQIYPFLRNEQDFDQYLCIIQNTYAGVCCPDLP